MGIVIRENITDFDADHVFDCGQCFRWSREDDGSYTGIAGGHIVNIKALQMSNDTVRLSIDNAEETDFDDFWHSYLNLDRDYAGIKEFLRGSDPVIGKAIDYGSGIRILKQEPWETLISFIISQNSNIPRIKGCLESLCWEFGTVAGHYKGRTWYNIPEPEKLASLTVADLAPCRLGYRADYIIRASQQVADDGAKRLAAIDKMTYTESYEYLTGLHGVGPKVANCIALFAGGHVESFPIDVWVKRVMNRLYNVPENDMKAMAALASERFGEYGGIAQQYLFYYMRNLDVK